VWCIVFDFLIDQNFLNALAAMIGPLAFFAAPTEEIEHLLFHQEDEVGDLGLSLPAFSPIDDVIAEAA
jgi:hypothetical protein